MVDRFDAITRGSSPHTRGAPAVFLDRAHSRGIIPAYAGSTLQDFLPQSEQLDHPRIRGEHFQEVVRGAVALGSSPHTRGALPARSGDRPPSRIIPAYAGSTIVVADTHAADADHPRIRGEHNRTGTQASSTRGSSPHTRGARAGLTQALGVGRIIPAYAGSTIWTSLRSGPAWDHPRIRGEHLRAGRASHRGRGSSPHTRGAPGRHVARLQQPGIIPAYAGST